MVRNLVTGVIGRLWYVVETLFSYGYALFESFFFIAFSGIFIILRSYLVRNEGDELALADKKPAGLRKHIRIFYGSQTGTAKVNIKIAFEY
jgi:hypothetical protein